MPLPSRPLPLSSPGQLTRREGTVLVLGALVLAVLIVALDPGTFGSTDWVRMHSAYKATCQFSVAEGRLPLWNPYHWLGRPFLADIETAFFYPPEWLYLVLEIHLACALTCALHLLLLLYGMVTFSRALGAERWPSLFVAFVLAASAPFAGCFTSGLIHYGPALCFVPLVLYLGMRVQAGATRRDIALLALVLGLQVLCGHPQVVWLTDVGLVVFLSGRRLERPWRSSLVGLGIDLVVVAVSLALGLMLAGVALLPFAELIGQGNRVSASMTFAALFAEPGFGWATLLVPTQAPFFDLQANAQLYAGLLPLVAGVCGLIFLRDRNVRGLGLLAGFAALCAAGDATPFFRVFFHLVPGVGWLRIHSRATALVTLALVSAAGLFLSRPPSRARRIQVAVVAGLAGLIGVGFCLLWPGLAPVAGKTALLRALLAGMTGLALVFWTLRQDERGRRPAAAVIAVLTMLDLGLAGRDLKRSNRETPSAEFEQTLHRIADEQGLIAPGKAPPRFFLPGTLENAGMRQGWSSVQGYSALAPGRVWRHMHQVLGIEPPFRVNTFPSPKLAAFGPFPYQSMSLVVGVAPGSQQLILNRHPDARAYLTRSFRLVRDDTEATALMRAGHDFHSTALLEEPVELPTGTTEPQARATSNRVTIDGFAPERIVISVESAEPALLVLAEPWYPGWSARVNGQVTPCLPANAWMRAVRVPAGQSQVELVFHSTYLAKGALLSLFALAVIVGLFAAPRRPRSRPEGVPGGTLG